MKKQSIMKLIGIKLSELEWSFTQQKCKSKYAFPGYAIYGAKKEGVDFFISVVPHHKDKNLYTLEFGWSKIGRFPEVLIGSFFRDSMPPPASRTEEQEYLSRVGVFFPKSLGDIWWEFGDDESINQVKVNEMIKIINDKIIPFFSLTLK